MKTNVFLIKSLNQLNEILNQLKEEEYCQQLNNLHGASIGQHARHILEFIDCLISIERDGTISYDDRKRDVNLECNLNEYLSRSNELLQSLEIVRNNFPIKIKCFLGGDDIAITETNYHREELFVLDHTIHHLAIIKIGITENFPQIHVPSEFGFTASTVRAKNLIPLA